MNIYILNKYYNKTAEGVICDAIQKFERKKQRRHELWILSCYIEFDLIEEYACRLSNNIRLTDIYLAFDFSEIYKIGPKKSKSKLDEITERLSKKKIKFEWMALASSNLVHSKAYAIMQIQDDSVKNGVVLTTSANFTKPGFVGGNVEIGYISTQKKDIKDFIIHYNTLWKDLGREIGGAVKENEDYLLKFALLSSGFFIHKWAGSLRQQIGIKYELTEFAKAQGTISPELKLYGFETGDTFTRQALKLDNLPTKEVPRQFIKDYTIETYWGRWCPSDAWNTLSMNFKGANEFKEAFKKCTDEKILSETIIEARKVQYQLADNKLIEPVSEDHLENWASRVRELRENNQRLERFYTGYDVHSLPYGIEQKEDVIDLFHSLSNAIETSKAKNIAKKKVESATSKRDVAFLALTEQEIQEIKKLGLQPS